MAPNLLVRAAFVRGDYDNNPKQTHDDLESIRTDFVLQNVYAHLIKSGCVFEAITAKNYKEEKVIGDIKEIVDSFRTNFLAAVQSLCSQLEFTDDTIGTVLAGVSNELFCEGITWSRIIALFVYVGELTLMCLVKSHSDESVHVMYECFCKYVKDNLMDWVEDHGGWEGIQVLSKSRADSNHRIPTPENAGWAKSFLHGTVRVIGTIAQIANNTDFP